MRITGRGTPGSSTGQGNRFGLSLFEEHLLMETGRLTRRPLSYGEIGELLSISRERVRQIEQRALARLRATWRLELLRELLYAE